MPQIQAILTVEQTAAVADGLDAYSRLCIGQLEEVAKLVRYGIIPMAQPNGEGERVLASAEVCDQIEDLMKTAKRLLGYSPNGSHGVGHKHVHISGLRSYEVQKVLAKVVAEQRNPNPEFCGVDYDGLGPRYTTDPAPVARVTE